jgi:hypothetical protein
MGQVVRLAAAGVRVLARGIRLGFHLARAGLRRCWKGTKLAGEITLMGLAGVAGGALLGVVLGLQNHDLETALPMNALAGGLIAAVVGTVLTVIERTDAAGRKMEEAEAVAQG